MTNESGDQKLLGNYRKLIDLVSADTNYNPANANISKTSLAAHYTGALAALDDVAAKNAPNKMATSDRQAAYDPLSSLMRRSFNMWKALGASKGVLDDAQTHLRKAAGRSAHVVGSLFHFAARLFQITGLSFNVAPWLFHIAGVIVPHWLVVIRMRQVPFFTLRIGIPAERVVSSDLSSRRHEQRDEFDKPISAIT